jgi:predicted Zn finger-like uncharacterized protein
MIVQCEACQTRFRLADEKVKAGGTKVRCSKCKEIFTVTFPEPEPQAPAEAVDFGSFNMEPVTEDTSGETPTTESDQTEAPEPQEQATPQTSASDDAAELPGQPEGSDIDFSALEADMGGDGTAGEELAENFSVADTSQLINDDTEESPEPPSSDSSIEAESQEEPVTEEQTEFAADVEETEESAEFDFNESPEPELETTEHAGADDTTSGPTEPSEFSFDSDEESGDDTSFSFDETEEETTSEATEEDEPAGEFSFDEENPFAKESDSQWSDETTDDTSFDFEEPQFDKEDDPAGSPASSTEGEGLQFGEIDFAGEDNESEAPAFQIDDDFSKATMEQKDEPEPFSPSPQQSAPVSQRDHDDDEPLPVPPAPKKSSLSRILVLLILLLVVLAGAAGFMFMQEGSLNLNAVTQYLPFLQEYIGETTDSSLEGRIGINIDGSSYVNGRAGQMLVIQGETVNNHPSAVSIITVKGVLLDAHGKALLQQTVFCGNKLDDAALKSKPFTAIEEAMNNQFGAATSNMNVASGASVPFTIVFRNLPDGIANINVEVVSADPGAS